MMNQPVLIHNFENNKEELPDFVRINPQEAVDWFFGLRIGVDWSNGTKAFNYPCDYIVEEDTVVIETAKDHALVYETMLNIIELKGVDVIKGKPVSFESLGNGRGILRLQWDVQVTKTKAILPSIIAYHLHVTEVGFRIYKMEMESFSLKDPLMTAVRIIKQVNGNIQAANRLVHLIQL